MIYNLNDIQDDPFKGKVFDVCIVGAGFAGITLATYLSEELNILLLEAGDIDYSEESQEIYKGNNIGHEYWDLTDARARWFGGTSNTWGGQCGTLESRDFEKKDFVEFSGWPISKKDLDPYLEEAVHIFGISGTSEAKEFTKGWDDVLKKPDKYFDSFDKWHSKQDYFKNNSGDIVKKRANIHCYLNANLTDMTLSDDLSSIKVLEIQNYSKKVFNARAKITILATGGIENPRLLLSFNKQCKNGIGNNNDLVGRMFSEHPHFELGEFIFEDHLLEAFQSGRLSKIKYLEPSNKFQAEDKILNIELELFPKNAIIPDEPINSFKGRLRDIICSSEWAKKTLNTIQGHEIYCYSSRYDQSNGIVSTMTEQTPNLSSRVTLGSDTDKFGMKRVELDWQLSKIEKHTLKRAAIRFAEMFAKVNLGRVKLDKWVLSDDPNDFPGFPHRLAGPHHMCTTRMSSSPKDGVVDANHKVFGIDNLYIAGSSVFSTTGRINPTFSIVQMSLRLTDHLNQQFDHKTSVINKTT